LKEIGEQMGLKGTDLKDFIREQQTLEREEREKQREHEREQQEKQRLWQAEQQDKEREQQDKERDHQYTLKKMELEQLELQMKVGFPMRGGVDTDGKFDEDDEHEATGKAGKGIQARGPKMPCFDERVDDKDAFLHRFEVYADSQGWKKRTVGSIFVSTFERKGLRCVLQITC